MGISLYIFRRELEGGKEKPLAVCDDPIPGCTYGNDGSGGYAACKNWGRII